MPLKTISEKTPKISRTAYVCDSAVITGGVVIGEQVFVAPNASVRADEPGSAIIIGDGCNIQDNVIVHALTNTKVVIGDHTSLSHGCIVHGPAEIGKNCFIGFGSVVFDCSTGDNCFVSHMALVKSVKIGSNKAVPDGAVIVRQIEADALETVKQENKEFALTVIKTNKMLARSYQRDEK
ncbi:MAG: carbonate dehydratase [Candidatus Methanoperedens sp.]|nr:carbonate dehydratase [Candidatus Methanoperedens sp.]